MSAFVDPCIEWRLACNIVDPAFYSPIAIDQLACQR